MTRIKRPAVAAGAAVLLALSLSACGGAPTDASQDDFCEAYNDNALNGDIAEDDFDAQAEALNDYSDKLEETGTPEDISDEARNGFEVVVEAFGDISSDDLDGDDTQKALEDKYADDQDDVEAFFEYANEQCGETPEDAPVEDAPTE